MVSYAVAILLASSRLGSSDKGLQSWRVAWTVACVLLVTHVLAAFHFEHNWNHTAALRHTAEQTARVTGINWGGGLYFNYAFLMLWFVDVAFLWRAPDRTHPRLHQFTNLACVFMVINATVVFGPRWWIWPVTVVGLIAVVICRCTADTASGSRSED